MTEHYFTAAPRTARRPKQISATLHGRPFSFTTDAGVFSRDRIDRGTRLLIKHLPLPVVGKALDLGCGYGPVGIVIAALSPEARVFLVDVNERAVALAQRNVADNGIRNADVRLGDGFAAVDDVRFDLIASNPPIRAGKSVIYAWVDEAYERLEPGGRFMLVARTSQGVKSLARKTAAVFGHVAEAGKGGGFRVIEAVRD